MGEESPLPGRLRIDRSAPILVGIAGRSGSGKTTLARDLASRWPAGCAVLSTDSYYPDLTHLSLADRKLRNFNDPAMLDWDLLAAHVETLRSGHPVDVPNHDFKNFTRAKGFHPVLPAPVVLLEGIFAFVEPRVRDALDWRVFLDVSEKACLERRVARDQRERGRTESEIRSDWHANVEPMWARSESAAREAAHFILPAETLTVVETAEAVIRWLDSPLKDARRAATL